MSLARIAARAARGAVAGSVATGLMSVLMLWARRRGDSGELPPERIAEALMDEGTGSRSERREHVLAVVAHLGFGTMLGSGFSLLPGRSRSLVPALFQAVLFALAVWAMSYQGWIPALRIMPPASRDEAGRRGVVLGSHLVFGAALALTLHMLDRRVPGERVAPGRKLGQCLKFAAYLHR